MARGKGHGAGLPASLAAAVRAGHEEKSTARRGPRLARHHGRTAGLGSATAKAAAADVFAKVQLQRSHHHRFGLVEQQQQQCRRDSLLMMNPHTHTRSLALVVCLHRFHLTREV